MCVSENRPLVVVMSEAAAAAADGDIFRVIRDHVISLGLAPGVSPDFVPLLLEA